MGHGRDNRLPLPVVHSLSGAAVKTSREESSNATVQGSFDLFVEKQDLQKIKEDKTMRDKDVSHINMYEPFLGSV